MLLDMNLCGMADLVASAPSDGSECAVVRTATVSISDLGGVFADEAARRALPGSARVYVTRALCPVPDGAEGGLFVGETRIRPGQVGREYFMTRGHFHAKRNRGECYWCTGGEGLLLLMDEDRRCRVENMRPGSAHYVPGHTAHRAVNTGREVLSVSACWPSDAGHDYASIARDGFSVRVFREDGAPVVVEVDE